MISQNQCRLALKTDLMEKSHNEKPIDRRVQVLRLQWNPRPDRSRPYPAPFRSILI